MKAAGHSMAPTRPGEVCPNTITPMTTTTMSMTHAPIRSQKPAGATGATATAGAEGTSTLAASESAQLPPEHQPPNPSHTGRPGFPPVGAHSRDRTWWRLRRFRRVRRRGTQASASSSSCPPSSESSWSSRFPSPPPVDCRLLSALPEVTANEEQEAQTQEGNADDGQDRPRRWGTLGLDLEGE